MSPSRTPLLPPTSPPRSMPTPKQSSIDAKRMSILVLCVMVGLASGSNYVYSAYAPQLASQLVISSTQVNLVGTAGNLGVYMTGPLWGKLVDSRGQRLPLLLGGICNAIGYFTVRAFVNHTIPLRSTPSGEPSSIGLFFLCFAMFLTGSGGSAGIAASVNAIAGSFSDKTRASATGMVLAGFGLSAFAFSTVGHLVYGGDAAGLLLLLALGTSAPLLVGSLFVRTMPPAREAEGYEPVESDAPEILIDDESRRTSIDSLERYGSTSLELVRSRSPTLRGRSEHPHVHFASTSAVESSVSAALDPPPLARASSLPPSAISMTPYNLLLSTDAHILFVVLALLCGTGLMYINNVGTVALALTREGHFDYDHHEVSGWQAKQVATISIWNCAGRILGGIFSDFCKSKFELRRIWFLPIVALGFIVSQVAGLNTTSVKHLWIVSTLLGGSYGSLFNVIPMLVLEWFGMTHFSQNYGWLCVAPVLGGNIFNLIFGRVYDAHTVGRIGAPESGAGVMIDSIGNLLKRAGGGIPDDGQHDCLVGANCYASAFKISALACSVAFLLSISAGIRRERKSRERTKALLRSHDDSP
ncbi:major facilitator superfamily domain-containing protein [Naematelia encephala]|uniref:Major facilitator superfamily domain-containing protein n=1 Tax=Naematelia encephala TaxID=71784 RepID=A0A1Y2AQB5_9TREE|nr:major facilitator superfamily domain-containing protein [Naematelia encephala]